MPENTSAARDRLLLSVDPEHLAAAALLAAGSADRIDNIAQALTKSRHNAALLFTAVRMCDKAVDETDCPAREWEAELLRVDGQNSEVWMHVATDRLRRGEDDAALNALQRAAAAPETRDYWPETVELVERGLAAAGGYPFANRSVLAFSLAGATSPDYQAYVRMCETQSKASPAWADACLRYGQLAEHQGKTHMGQAIARSIQIKALEAIGDDVSRNEVQAKQDRARRYVSESPLLDIQQAGILISGSPAHFSRYFATLRERGELAAQQMLREEAKHLASQLDTKDCL